MTEPNIPQVHPAYGEKTTPDVYICGDVEQRAELFNDGYQEAMKQRTGGAEHRAWLVQTAEQIIRSALHAPVPVPANLIAGQIADAVLSEVDFDESEPLTPHD